MGDALNGGDSLTLTTPGHQKLRRFVKCEQEEAAQEHCESNGAQRQNEISPAPVVCLGACCVAFAGEIGNKGPGKHTNQELDLKHFQTGWRQTWQSKYRQTTMWPGHSGYCPNWEVDIPGRQPHRREGSHQHPDPSRRTMRKYCCTVSELSIQGY